MRSTRRRSSWPNLPAELYRPIIEFVTDKDTLARLALVCRATQTEAERILYASIVLHPTETPRLCASILSHSRLPRLVKKCELFLQLKVRAEWAAYPDQHDLVRASRALLARLSRFTRLEELHVQSLVQAVESDLGKALVACNLRLRAFRCSCPLDGDMLAFVASQRDLREVFILSSRVKSTHVDNRVTTAAAPTLRYLESLRVLTPQAAQVLIPDRPVTRVEILVWNESCVAKVVSSLARSSGPVRSLLVSQGFKLAAEELKQLAQHMPHLRYLGECLLTDAVSSTFAFRSVY